MILQAYVVFVQLLGGAWLERNLYPLLAHVLDLVANPKAASSHVDAVYSRKCINFILRSILGHMLGEKAQTSAVKEMALIIAKQMNSIGKLMQATYIFGYRLKISLDLLQVIWTYEYV